MQLRDGQYCSAALSGNTAELRTHVCAEQVLGSLLRGAAGAALLSPHAAAVLMDALHQRLAPLCAAEPGHDPARRAEGPAEDGALACGEAACEQQCAGALAALRVVDIALGPPAAGAASLAPGGRLVSERIACVLADVFCLAWRAGGASGASDAEAGTEPGSPAAEGAANDAVLPSGAALLPGANGAWHAEAEPDLAVEPNLAAGASLPGVRAAAARVWTRGARLAGFSGALEPTELDRLRRELVRPLAEAVRLLQDVNAAADVAEVRHGRDVYDIDHCATPLPH